MQQNIKSVIEVHNITKTYRNYTALKNLNFEVSEGEIFGFLGPSGAGKTTTIKILTGQLKKYSGQASILNKDVEKIDEDLYKKVGIVSDMSGIYERMSVYQNLLIFAKLFRVDKSYIDELLKKFDLYNHKQKPAGKLSTGMKQRLILIRSIIHKPTLLFLDEPTSGLDPRSAKAVHEILLELKKQGTAIFLTTHNMEEATKLCDRVALLNDGKVIEMDTPENLCLKYNKQRKYQMTFSDQSECILEENEMNIEKINQWMIEGKIETLHTCEPNLEQVFIEATGRNL